MTRKGMLKRNDYWIYIFSFFFIITNVTAQKTVKNQQLFWMRYNLSLQLNQNYKLRYEIEERVYHTPWRQHQFLNKAHFERALGNSWSMGVGFTYLVQSLPNDPEKEISQRQIELRPQFEIETKQKLSSKIVLSHRYWNEFRFFDQPGGAYNFSNIRSRYKLELNYKLTDKMTLKAFDEIHLNITNKKICNVFDQNRYGGSIQIMPTKSLGFELGYINWFQQKKTANDFYNRNITRLTIHHNIDIGKSKSI